MTDQQGEILDIYSCKCDCGKIIYKDKDQLNSNLNLSCGCYNNKKVDLTGKIFNRLTVIKYYKSEDKIRLWLCSCNCGSNKEIIVSTKRLINNNVKSCGCLRKENITLMNKSKENLIKEDKIIKEIKIINEFKINQKIGNLTIIEIIKMKIGQKFGKLTIIENKFKYNLKCSCECDSNKFIEVSQHDLLSGHIKSCGCLKNPNLIGKVFGRLTVISKYESKERTNNNKYRQLWNCECSCKNMKVLSTSVLCDKSSCGCLGLESLEQINRIYSREESVIRKVYYRYKDSGNLPYKDFFKLSQQNCYYCNIKPSRILKNKYLDFTYNGIDAINSNIDHFINNIITCCFECNSIKSNKTIYEFENYIKLLTSNNRISINEHKEKSSLIYVDKTNPIYERYKKYLLKMYNDCDFKFEKFYQLSQLNCYYCNAEPMCTFSSKYNKKVYTIIRNGLDRINNFLPHNYDNIVTCCKYCNWAKGNKTIDDFYNWIERIKINKFWDKEDYKNNNIYNGIAYVTI